MEKSKFFGGIFIVLAAVVAFAVPVYGQELSLQKQGNIKGMEDEVKEMKEDYLFLEKEIINLRGECH